MCLWLDLDELIDGVRLGADVYRAAFAQARRGSVEEQLQRQLFILSANELKDRRIQARNADFRDLRSLGDCVFRGIELDVDKFSETAVAVDRVLIEDLDFRFRQGHRL